MGSEVLFKSFDSSRERARRRQQEKDNENDQEGSRHRGVPYLRLTLTLSDGDYADKQVKFELELSSSDVFYIFKAKDAYKAGNGTLPFGTQWPNTGVKVTSITQDGVEINELVQPDVLKVGFLTTTIFSTYQ